ncbi:hypothetical protein CBR_g19672 [Chara braunii]|uniref:Membrane protein insertion efficiency factor n=1 Tax=Chara braunii TaxID=69332 RepID=A0A388KYN2_CHABU|nr:hypothetical protein CBR_g19672 [Chara braunii]|eukprot:GBG75159.1 hypothetical protein CBR_g19672 [Chara braunii]
MGKITSPVERAGAHGGGEGGGGVERARETLRVSLGKGSRTNGPDRRGKVLRRCASASDWAGDEEDGQLADHLHHWGWQVQYTDEERGAPGEQDNAHESYAISSSSAYQKHGENERERRRRRRRHPDSPSVVCNQPPRGTEEWPEEAAGYDDGDDGSGPDEAYVDGLDADDVEIGLEEDEDRDAGDGANVCGEDDMTADMNEGDPEDGSGLPAKTPHMETNLEEEETDKKVDDSDPDENGSSLPAKTPEMGKEVEDEEENDKGDGNGDEEKEQIGVKAAVTLLRFYKREISPWIPGSCRYVPTCSEYAIEAYTRYGLAKGTVLTACRICRCNPLGGSGFDPPRWFGESKLQPPPPPPSPPPPPPSRL